MSKLWMAGEIQVDIEEPFRLACNAVEQKVNSLTEGVSLGEKIKKWTFIAMIQPEGHSDYDEVIKKSSRGTVLEFRLKIPHTEFLSATPKEQIRLIVKGLFRSVSLMSKLGVSASVQEALNKALTRAEFELVGPGTLSQKN